MIFEESKNANRFLKTWSDEFAKTKNIDVNILFYKKELNLYKDFTLGKLDGGFFNYDFFIKNEKTIKKYTKLFWSLSFSKENGFNYCLIANKQSEIKNINQLKSKSLSLVFKDKIPYNWINKQSLSIYKKPIKKILKNINYVKQESTAILNVYFKKTDFAVVKKYIWETMKEINPSIENKIKLIQCTTNNLFPIVGFIKEDVPKKDIDTFLNLSKDNDEDVKFFDLILVDHIFLLENKHIEEMRKFTKEYESLKLKYH